MNIIIFEDGLHDNFYPLSLTKPLWELRSGLCTFRERMALFVANNPRLSGAEIHYFTRDYLVPYYREKYPHESINDPSVLKGGGEFVFINAVKYPSDADFTIDMNSILVMGEVPVVVRVDGTRMQIHEGPISTMLMGLGLREIDYCERYKAEGAGRKANFIWDLVDLNPAVIKEDWDLAGIRGNGIERKDVTISGDGNQVYIEEGVVFDPYVFIDASGGPVAIAAGTRIHSFSRIEGPCSIGRDCIITGGKIKGGTSLGNSCRVGGEVEQSIFHGYGNKYHDGFIGHAYIGEWTNLGALTTNSDLKNNYSNVKVYIPASRKKTGSKKVGCFMGDFVKTSIGTLINTGTSIGPGAMLVHAGNLTPFHIPPFSWYVNSTLVRPGGTDDFISTCREAMARRNVAVTENFINLINGIFEMTSPEQGRS